MKRSLVQSLIENSKTTRRVTGEIGPVSYGNIHTPDNHKDGKKNRQVDGTKGLGQQPKKGQKVAQVQPPKKRERRSMQETLGKDVLPPGADKANMDLRTSAQKNRDEGMKKPKVDKVKGGPTPSPRIEKKRKRYTDNPAKIGKPTHTGKSFQHPIPVKVQTVREELEELAKLIGPFELDMDLLDDVLEANHPDDMNWKAFDRYWGGDEETEEEARKAMAYAVEKFLQGPQTKDALDEYKKTRDEDDRIGVLYNLFDEAYAVAQAEAENVSAHAEVDKDLLRSVFEKTLEKRVDFRELQVAMSDYLRETEDGLDEDSLSQEGSDNSLKSAERILSKYGYQPRGGGFTGGEKQYAGPDGVIGIQVHSFKPTQVIGWRWYPRQGDAKEGREVAQLNDLLQNTSSGQKAYGDSPRVSPWMRKRMATREMSSGGAMASGGIASTAMPMMGTRKRSTEDTGDAEVPQTFEEYVAVLDPYMKKKYYLTWADAAGDREPIERAIQQGIPPKEFADDWAERYGLDSSDDPWMPQMETTGGSGWSEPMDYLLRILDGKDTSNKALVDKAIQHAANLYYMDLGVDSPEKAEAQIRKEWEKYARSSGMREDETEDDANMDKPDRFVSTTDFTTEELIGFTNEDVQDMPFMFYIEAVDRILDEKFNTSEEQIGIVRDDFQEYADAQEAGQTPYEMAKDWVRNGDTYRREYSQG